MGLAIEEAYKACKKLFKINKNENFNKEDLDWSALQKKAYDSEFVKIGEKSGHEIYEGFRNIPLITHIHRDRIIRVCDKSGRCIQQIIPSIIEQHTGAENAINDAVVSLINALSKGSVI